MGEAIDGQLDYRSKNLAVRRLPGQSRRQLRPDGLDWDDKKGGPEGRCNFQPALTATRLVWKTRIMATATHTTIAPTDAPVQASGVTANRAGRALAK